MRVRQLMRGLAAVAWVSATVLAPAAPGFAQTGNGQMAIDLPGAGTHTQKVWMVGWAIDTAATSGTGVSTVHVWAYPTAGGGAGPVFLGAAEYGLYRPDVDNAFGGSGRYTHSG